MKNISILALAGILTFGAANADFQPTTPNTASTKGGFVSGAETIATVKQVMEMRDDIPVIVKGHIVQRMGDEMYLFEDATGTIRVEIDDDEWRGQTVTPNDTVKLYGEVDRGIFKTEIEVNYVEKL